MTTRYLLILVTASLLAGRADAQLAEGAAAPKFELTDWINHPAVGMDGLQGRVVALAFVRLKTDASFDFLGPWNDLARSFALEPITFLAITNEAPDYVRNELAREKLTTPFVINPSDDAALRFEVQIFPSVVILGPRGTVVYHDKPGSTEAMADVIRESLISAQPFPTLPKSQSAIARGLEKWDLGKAYEQIAKTLENPRLKAEEKAPLEATRSLLERWTADMAAAAESWITAQDWLNAGVALHRLATEHAGIPGAQDAAARLEQLRAREDLRAEIDAAIDFAKANKFERLRDWKRAQKDFAALAKKSPDSQAGVRAAGLAEVLKSRTSK